MIKLKNRHMKDTFQFNEDFIKNVKEERDEGYFLEVDVQYFKKLHERMKFEKVAKHVANLHDKTEYVIHIKNLKQALNHGLLWKKFID